MRKHINREHSSFKHSIKRPLDEYCRVEIISFAHEYTQTYAPNDMLSKATDGALKTIKGWSAIICADKKNSFSISIEYFVKLAGEYRIDLLYENTKDGNLVGTLNNDEVYFEGDVNNLKLKTLFKNFAEGNQAINLTLPQTCCLLGVIIRKTKEYVFNSVKVSANNMVATDVDVTNDSQIQPSECSFHILFDSAFEYLESPTGLYMDYMDEVNIYFKEYGAKDETQVFGGYLSSILPNNKRTELNVSCADRLIDGQNKFVLNQMKLLGGTKTKSENEYTSDMDRDFKSYGQALKYLCKVLQLSLKNNIGSNDLVLRETAAKGFNIDFGKKKKIKKVKTTIATSKVSKNFITLRNGQKGNKKQEIILYQGKDYRNTPIDITNYTNMGIVYGLGDPVKTYKEKTTEVVDNGEGNAGSQSFNKCGVSKDGKYVMAIGLPSASGDQSICGGYTWHKRMFKNECPYCKKMGRASNKLVFDIFYGDSVNGVGRSPCNNNRYESGGGVEGHIFCKSCDSDYSIVTGKRHGGTGGNLTPVTKLEKSSKSEAQKLKRGEYVGTATGEKLSPSDIFDAIWKLAKKKGFKYQLRGNTTSDAKGLERTKVGDCWAFSEWIFNQLVGYGVQAKVVQYATTEAPNGTHRSVMYKNSKNQWVDYPYRSHGWHTWLYNTSGSKHPNSTPFKSTKGGTIASAKSKSGSSTQTTTVTRTEGYDRDKPIQGYFAVTISTKKSFKAKTKTFYVGFTQKEGGSMSLTGFSPVWINNAVKQVNVDLLRFVKNVYNDYNDSNRYYLHSIKFIVPVNKSTETGGSTKIENWFSMDKSTKDHSSCKMDLYSINFNNSTLINPRDLDTCGKSVNSIFEELIGASQYTASMTYAKHRCDDTINFSVDNKTEPSYIAHEGDDDNVLEITGISYTPRSSLYNTSIVVFKDKTDKYKYVNSHDLESVLRYGEQVTLQTSSEIVGSKEAYYNAVNNNKYNPSETFNFGITLPFFVPTYVGDLFKVIANSRKLNTVKNVASVKYSWNNKQIPKVQTDLGLGELPMDLQIKKELREIRASAKKESTHFSSSAEAITDEDVYEWDN